MSNLEKYEKPKWIKLAEDYPKLRNATVDEIQNTVKYLTVLLGASKDTTDEEIIVFVDYLRASQSRWTTGELKEAYIMAINGDFGELKLYNKIDAIQTGKIMKAYQDFLNRNNKVKNYQVYRKDERVVSQSEKIAMTKKFIQEMYEHFLNNNVAIEELHSFWGFLKKHQKITFKQETQNQMIKDAEEWKRLKAIKIKSEHRKGDFKSILGEIDTNTYLLGYCVFKTFENAKKENIKNIITEQIFETEI